MRSTVRNFAITAVALGLTAGLSACGGDSATVPTGGNGSVTVDEDNGDVTIETDDGTVVGGTASLPDGFPVDEIPLVEGDIISAFGVNTDIEKGWSVAINPSGDDGVDGAVDLLTAKGFAVESTVDMGIGETSTLRSDAWEVLVAATNVEGDRSITYTVAATTS